MEENVILSEIERLHDLVSSRRALFSEMQRELEADGEGAHYKDFIRSINPRKNRGLEEVRAEVLKRAFDITSSFEGKGYAQTTGDFDGQGLSWGFLQWCLGQGSLQPVLLAIYERWPTLMRTCLMEITDEVLAICHGTANWRAFSAKINKSYNKSELKPQYQKYFEALGNQPEIQAYQRERGGVVALKGLSLCHTYGLTTEKGFCLCFDIVTQNGGINKSAPDYIAEHTNSSTPEAEKLKVIAEAIARKSNPRWYADVKARKLCVATGAGTVHGDHRDLGKEYGLKDGPWSPQAQAAKEPDETPTTPPQPPPSAPPPAE